MKLTGYIGRNTIRISEHLIGMHALIFLIFKFAFKKLDAEDKRKARKETANQIYHTAIGGLPIVFSASIIFGGALVFQFIQISHQYDIGNLAILLICRELGPIITAFIIIMRSAAAMTLEITYLNGLGRFNSIIKAKKNPFALICFPKFAGMTISFICLTIIFNMIAIVGSYIVILTLTEAQSNDFLSQIAASFTLNDIIVAFVKPVCFGMATATICIFRGFKNHKRRNRIFANASGSAVESFFYCIIINIVISIHYYV
jgi:phospholipid/cholesterol/gamma-HCH transport system permease protein